MSCPSSGYLGTIPGVIIGGSSYIGVGIALQCFGGVPSYDPVVFFNGPFNYLNMTVSPGDTVAVKAVDSISSQGTVTDITTGITRTKSFYGFSSSYIDVGDDGEYYAYTQLGVPYFGTVRFTGATVNGAALGSLSPSRYNMGNGTTKLIQTGLLNSAGNAFTTTFYTSQEPTIVQGRVTEGLAGQLTLSATSWPATFASVVSSSPSDFTATIYWGDGSSPSTGSITSVASSNCRYGPVEAAGYCFAVTGRHRYAYPGADFTYVTVDAVGGPGSSRGVAEIVNATSGAATRNIGVLTWNTMTPGRVDMCTATAIDGLDMVLTGRHCFDVTADGSNDAPSANPNFEFAPMHSGNCGGGGSPILSVADCEGSGGIDPYGYWTGDAWYPASDSRPASGSDTMFITLGDTSSTGYSLIGKIKGLPVHFLAPHGQWTISSYGYPGRNGIWSLQNCLNLQDLSAPSDSVLGIAPCNYQYGLVGGTSGGPFISSNLLPNAIAGSQWFMCNPENPPRGCADPQGDPVWPHAVTQPTAIGNYMSNNAMQVLIAAAYAATFG